MSRASSTLYVWVLIRLYRVSLVQWIWIWNNETHNDKGGERERESRETKGEGNDVEHVINGRTNGVCTRIVREQIRSIQWGSRA